MGKQSKGPKAQTHALAFNSVPVGEPNKTQLEMNHHKVFGFASSTLPLKKMANIIEKRLPKAVRNQMQAMIAAALGLFLGLQYNDYLKSIFEKILPDTTSLLSKGIVLLVLTIVVVYATIYLQKLLDGK